MKPNEPKIESTFFSDGTRMMSISWKSREGERETLLELTDLVTKYFKSKAPTSKPIHKGEK